MSKAALEAISTNAWAEKAITGQLMYRFVISGENGYVRSITTDYLNTEDNYAQRKKYYRAHRVSIPVKRKSMKMKTL
jgi:hypothetical protein